jgi:exosome complex component RRP42
MASSLLLSTQLSQSEQDFIRQGCRDDCRSDGRTRDEFRSYTIVTGHDATDADNDTNMEDANGSKSHQQQQPPPLVLSNGSARLFSSSAGCCNHTHILCSVKAEVVHPAPNQPNQGVVELYVDTLTTALGNGNSRSRQRQQTDGWTATLQQLLVEHLVDLSALVIVPGMYVWRLHVDLYLLQADAGSLLDAASHVMRAALANTLLPSITTTTSATTPNPTTAMDKTATTDSSNNNANTDLVVDGDVWKARPPPGVERAPILVTVAVLKCPTSTATNTSTNTGNQHGLPVHVLIVNATLEEEACAYCLVHVAVVTSPEGKQTVCACQKTGRGSLPVPLLPEIMATALAATGSAQQQYQIQQPSSQQGQGSAAASYGLLQEQFAMQ